MQLDLLEVILQLNPWLNNPEAPILDLKKYIPREQAAKLLSPEWDKIWLVLVGPRQAGKTTLGKYLCQKLITENRFKQLLYLNCDFLEIRNQLNSPKALLEIITQMQLNSPIVFIDEVQRLENPGLVLKAIADLKLPIKMIASGSSQLEIKSKVQEHLTGRHLEALVLPLSYAEIKKFHLAELLIFGCYPQITLSNEKAILLKQLFDDYISKDIIEILKIGKPDVMQRLISLIAHSSGQLVNFNQLATDCRVSATTIQNYLAILEKTYVLHSLTPFVGNKRTEITSNPVYYFIDNGFRNQALKNFSNLENRTDTGLLIESAVFQEIYKLQTQHFKDFNIHFWRTKSGAEVDFVLNKDGTALLPIEVKHREMKAPHISRGFRSFIQAYQPSKGIFITKNFFGKQEFDNCMVYFIPMARLQDMLAIIDETIPT